MADEEKKFDPKNLEVSRYDKAVKDIRSLQNKISRKTSFKLSDISKKMKPLGFEDLGGNSGSANQFYHPLLEDASHLTSEGLFTVHYQSGSSKTSKIVRSFDFRDYLLEKIEYVIDQLEPLRKDMKQDDGE